MGLESLKRVPLLFGPSPVQLERLTAHLAGHADTWPWRFRRGDADAEELVVVCPRRGNGSGDFRGEPAGAKPGPLGLD